jgi:hypothetical protein
MPGAKGYVDGGQQQATRAELGAAALADEPPLHQEAGNRRLHLLPAERPPRAITVIAADQHQDRIAIAHQPKHTKSFDAVGDRG